MRHQRRTRPWVAALFMACCFAMTYAQGIKELEASVKEYDLANGLKLVVLPRAGAPVVSMVTYADVGGVDEIQNATGLAHVFEHMAFKGTTTVGSTDYAGEKLAMQREDAAFVALRTERLRRPRPDPEKVKQLEAAFKAAQDEARKFVIANEIGEIIEREGGQGLNAFTNFDTTAYHYSMPSNKLELWAALEADRFANPVLREFYKEKDVIMEEKRMSESNPTGRLISDFFPVAFQAHMYRSYVIGQMSDLMAITRAEAEAWFKKYYGAKNLTVAVVGDVDPAKVLPMLKAYLEKIPAGQKPGPVVTQEPPQRCEKRMIMEDPSQPILVMGYHCGDINDPDYPVYKAISDILGGGRSSRLFKSLVKEKQVALQSMVMVGIQEKYPGLMLVIGVPNKGKTNQECEKAINDELVKLMGEPVTPEELEGVKARAKAQFLNSMDDNMGIALGLAKAQNLQGSWKELFNALDRIDQVKAEDIQRVAKKVFVKSNLTVAMLENAPSSAK